MRDGDKFDFGHAVILGKEGSMQHVPKANFAISAGLAGAFLLALILTGLPACSKAQKSEAELKKPTVDFDTWMVFKSAEDGFEILTPRSFTKTTDKVATEAGEIPYSNYIAQPNYRQIYVVNVSDSPEGLIAGKDPLVLLQGARDGLIQQYSGTLEKEKPIALDGHQGLEVQFSGTEKATNFLVRARFFLVKNRLYQLYAMTEKEYEVQGAFDKYLGSFKLK
jgi:hypothetical protein